jgi:hypothetical protein
MKGGITTFVDMNCQILKTVYDDYYIINVILTPQKEHLIVCNVYIPPGSSKHLSESYNDILSRMLE